MLLHFYIEANPIRAKFRTLENLKTYTYSSYGFYAYGIRTQFTYRLTIPAWYTNLGKTARERQRKYRKLFRAYLKESTRKEQGFFMNRAIGEASWVDGFINELVEQIKSISVKCTQNIKPALSG
jgi:hypothetical protein